MKTVIGFWYFWMKKAVIEREGWKVLQGPSSRRKALQEVRNKLRETLRWSGEWLLDVFNFMESTPRREQALREEKNWALWSLIVNFATPSRDYGHGTEGYTSMVELLTKYLEEDPTKVSVVSKGARADVWLGCLMALMSWRRTCGQFLVTRKKCRGQRGRNDFDSVPEMPSIMLYDCYWSRTKCSIGVIRFASLHDSRWGLKTCFW